MTITEPCPVCGSDSIKVEFDDLCLDYVCVCQSCGHIGEAGSCPSLAVSAWNEVL